MRGAPSVELQPAEQVTLLCRRHWLYLYPRLAADLLAAALPVLIAAWLARRVGGRADAILALLSTAWVAGWGVRAYFHWYRYHHDIWVITDQRLLDAFRRNWFHRQLASADLVDIEDVSVHRDGLLPTLFHYGDLRVQTAGEQSNFVLAGIPDPEHVLTVLDAVRDRARRDAAPNLQ